MSIEKVVVIGGGTMGRQIALNSAIGGVETWLYDAFPNVIETVDTWGKNYIAERIAKGKMTEEAGTHILSIFHPVTEMEAAVKEADLVIEAIYENLEAKIQLFQKLDVLCPTTTILASNSSTFMPSDLVKGCPNHGDRYLNMHYFNPAIVMKLLEIVMAPQTSEETLSAVRAYGDQTKKISIVVRKEVPGYVVNNLFGGITNAAWELLEDGVADFQDIDTGARLGLGHPQGPFQVMDGSGLDTILSIRKARHEINPDKYPAPCKILEEKVAKGECGKKCGKGFYDYTK